MQEVLSKTAKDKGWDVDFAVPLVVEVGIGDNWDEAHGFFKLKRKPTDFVGFLFFNNFDI